MKNTYNEIQKRLGTERSQFEWPVTLLVIALPFLAMFASYACVVLFGPKWAALFAAFPLVGMLPLISRFRTLSARAARSQVAFDKLVGYPSAYLPSDVILKHEKLVSSDGYCFDPVTGKYVVVCSVRCGVHVRTSRGYQEAPSGLVSFAFGSDYAMMEFLTFFKVGTYCKIGEDGPVPASSPYKVKSVPANNNPVCAPA